MTYGRGLPQSPSRPPDFAMILTTLLPSMSMFHSHRSFKPTVVAPNNVRHHKPPAYPPWFALAMKQALAPINQPLDRFTALATQTAKLSAIVRMRTSLSYCLIMFIFAELQLAGWRWYRKALRGANLVMAQISHQNALVKIFYLRCFQC